MELTPPWQKRSTTPFLQWRATPSGLIFGGNDSYCSRIITANTTQSFVRTTRGVLTVMDFPPSSLDHYQIMLGWHESSGDLLNVQCQLHCMLSRYSGIGHGHFTKVQIFTNVMLSFVRKNRKSHLKKMQNKSILTEIFWPLWEEKMTYGDTYPI